MGVSLGPFSLERALNAVAKVRDAVGGGNAVMLWVSRVDESAVRNTQDVDLLINRSSLAEVCTVLEGAGFTYRHAAGLDLFLDGEDGKPREAVHVVFAHEKVRAHELAANPGLDQSVETTEGYRVLALEALVQIKLTAFRDKDRVHLRDLAKVGLVDRTWPGKFPRELADRLQMILDTPNG